MRKERKTFYIANDGTPFENQAGCEAYEKKQAEIEANTSYWQVTHGPDLCEGRGYCGLLLIQCYVTGYLNLENLILDFCFRKFGRPVAFVQGVAPMENWIVRRTDRKKYLEPNVKIRVGDYDYPAKRIKLVMGEKEDGLIDIEGDSGE